MNPTRPFRTAFAALLLLSGFTSARAAGQLRIRDDILPTVLVNRNYSYQLQGQGGTGGPYTFACPAPCGLPPNYSLSSGGLISYTYSGTNPTLAGHYSATVTLADGQNPIASQTLKLEILKAEAWSNWCPRGHYGGNATSVAASSQFATDNTAVAGSPNGATFTLDGGRSWNPVFSLGPLPVTSIAVDQCTSNPLKFWVLSGNVSITQLRNLGGPFSGTVYSDPGAVQRVDGLGATGTVTFEFKLPAAWTGGRRRIRQAYRQCTGEMLASDDKGGVIYRNGGGTWVGLNSFSGITGPFAVRDIAYGDNAKHTRGAALVHDINAGVTKLYTIDTALSSIWARCADLPAPAAGAQWLSLALTPDGQLVAGSTGGDTRVVPVSSCGLTPTSNPGPAFRDGNAAVNPAVNGFVVSPCYGSGGNKGLYAVTSAGVFHSADVTAGAANPFLRQGVGLLSETLGDLAVSSACTDGRLISASGRRGLFFGDANGFCPAQTGQDNDAADFNAFAATRAFVSPTASACGALNTPIGLHAGSRSAGLFRVNSKGHELFYAGATREKSIVDLDTAFNGTSDVLYAATNSGVYRSDDGGLHYNQFYPTDEPLLALRGAPGNSAGGAYAISSTSLYAAGAAPPWSRIFPFPVTGGQAADLYVGGPLSSNPNDDTVWIAFGTGGLMEFHTIGGTPALLTQSTGLNGLDIRVVTATQKLGVPNLVYLHAKNTASGAFQLLRGVKPAASPYNQQISFSPLTASGLPVNEEAIHIVVENRGLATAGYVWVLLPSQGLYLSTDGGSSFTHITGTRTNSSVGNGMPPNFIPIALIPSRDFDSSTGKRDLAVLVAGKGVYYSNDGGNTYCFGPTVLNQVPVSSASGAGLAPLLTENRMKAAFAAASGAAAPDAPQATQPDGGILAITTSTTSNDIQIAGTDHGVFYSDDGGANWANRSFADQAVGALLVALPGDAALIAGSTDGIWRSADWGQNWTHVYTGGTVTAFAQNATGGQIAATLAAGAVLRSIDGGLTFSPQSGPTDGNAVDYNGSTTLAAPVAPVAPAGATAAYWMAGTGSGVSYSSDAATWTLANGSNSDYLISGLSGSWQAAATLGGTPSKVLSGNSLNGLYRTLSGGDIWRKVSGTGSGLETTSQNAAALVTATSQYGNLDALVGMVGAANGGVYLSGDAGEHWTQINAGYDPNNLNITTLAKTSCTGCPVQYYSGTYGGGVYTRTVTVNPAPAITGWCVGSTGCTCGTASVTGPQEGGQAFRLCGSGFAGSAAIEFDGLAATGCSFVSSSAYTCTGTPAHFVGPATIRLRNSDTRAGSASANAYSYVAGAPRAANTLRIAKNGADAALTWTCSPACNPVAARVYRSQNAAFSLNIEQYNGGTAGSFTNTAALATSAYPSYFWSVE